MDLNLPNRSGVEVTRELCAEQPRVRVIALAMYRDDDMIAAAVQAGVSGYVLKDARGSDLLQAIRTVAAGGAAVDPMVTSRVLEQYRRLSARTMRWPRGFSPSARRKPCDLLAAGASNRTIAEKMYLSEQSVKNTLSGIYRKLGAGNRTVAAAIAWCKGLIKAEGS